MQHFTTEQTYIPIRLEPSHRSEQTSQLLYGEVVSIDESKGDWAFITTQYDAYKGWVELKLIKAITDQEKCDVVVGMERLIKSDNQSLWLSTGSEIRESWLAQNNDFRVKINPELNHLDIVEIASQFLGSPYLWGGRSFMGIDCSGLMQVVFKSLGIFLPRDAAHQVACGENIPFLSHANKGDLAFFDDEEGAITHVGLIIDENRILHASGSVRIDKIDQQGIFNVSTKNYSHKLRVIKRLDI